MTTHFAFGVLLPYNVTQSHRWKLPSLPHTFSRRLYRIRRGTQARCQHWRIAQGLRSKAADAPGGQPPPNIGSHNQNCSPRAVSYGSEALARPGVPRTLRRRSPVNSPTHLLEKAPKEPFKAQWGPRSACGGVALRIPLVSYSNAGKLRNSKHSTQLIN